jgi:hypothetical protein
MTWYVLGGFCVLGAALVVLAWRQHRNGNGGGQ